MPEADIKVLSRAAAWIAIAYFGLFVAWHMLVSIAEGEADVFWLGMLVDPWMASPVVAAACLVRASRTRVWAGTFLLFEVSLILSVIWLIYYYRYVEPSSTGALALMIWPACQWAACAVALVIALIGGWRARDSWLT